MKTNLYLTIILTLFLSLTVAAQKISKPTLIPSPATAAQKQLLSEGVKLHDQKQYDEAIKKYEQVLQENPANDEALYEMTFTYYTKKDSQKAVESAYKLVQYKSMLGASGYVMIANVLEDSGKSKEAIELYQKAIEKFGDEADYQPFASSLEYNLAVAYFKQKQYPEAREAAKKAVQANFSNVAPNYVLAVLLQNQYKIPALLAAARLVSLELNTDRAKKSAAIFLDVLKPAKKDEKTGNINIFLNLNAPKDEGDFGMYDLLLGTLTTVRDKKDKDKSDEEMFAEAVDTVIALLQEDDKLPKTFVGKTYVPFMSEMKKKGFSKTFAYLILQQNGNKEAEKWLAANAQQKNDFIEWSKNYRKQ